MKEVIQEIKESIWNQRKYSDFEGYEIKTNKQTIRIGISSGQNCCEDFGYLTTNDDLKEFIGAEISGIKLTDISLNTKLLKEKFEYGFDGGGIQFVDIETDKGPLQFAVYNSHNGFYGHSIEIKSDQLIHEGDL